MSSAKLSVMQPPSPVPNSGTPAPKNFRSGKFFHARVDAGYLWWVGRIFKTWGVGAGPSAPRGRGRAMRPRARPRATAQAKLGVSLHRALSLTVRPRSSGRGASCTGSGNSPDQRIAPSPRGAERCGQPPLPASCCEGRPRHTRARRRDRTAPVPAAAVGAVASRPAASTTSGSQRWLGAGAAACASHTSRPASAQSTPRGGTAAAAYPPCVHRPEKHKSRHRQPRRFCTLSAPALIALALRYVHQG